MRLAYLTPLYPKVSHTFIRREIRALEERGHSVLRVSIRRAEAALTVDPADEEERRRTVFCLGAGPLALLRAVAATLLVAPLACLAALAHSLRLARTSRRGVVAHVAYWVEACFIAGLLRRERIEHVHVHFGTNAATVALLIRRLGGPPFSMTVHGPDEIDDPIGHAIADKVAASRFTIGISHYTVAQLRRWSAPEHWSKLHVVHCSVDDAFLADARPVDAGSRALVCVGRLCPQKGQLTLVEAFAEVARRIPDARLVLAGDGELRDAVEARIRELDLRERVTITGWIDEAAVRRQLGLARALVLPSFAEGLPVVLMEALAMHRPVVSTYIAGIPELVIPGENGWLVPASDVDALRDAMLEVLSTDPAKLSEMGARGALRVRERHYATHEAGRLEKLLALAAQDA